MLPYVLLQATSMQSLQGLGRDTHHRLSPLRAGAGTLLADVRYVECARTLAFSRLHNKALRTPQAMRLSAGMLEK